MVGQRNFWKALGPGLLFAGAAVGVSHLVQATRAGADYGFSLILLVVAACLFKYPAFAFGPYYAAATGSSLVEAYRRQGRWALWLYGLVTFGTMFAIQAAVTATTAGLGVALLGPRFSVFVMSGFLMLLCAGLLRVGGFTWLDGIIKVMALLLTVCTFWATALALPNLNWGTLTWFPQSFDRPTLLFCAALVGWMPSAIDIAVWHSLWTLAREKQTSHRPHPKEAMLDFNVGYLGTFLLALCFVILGTAVMHGSGKSFAGSAPAFAAQVVDLYAASLGEWSRSVIGLAAFSIMFSTTLTVVDGFPRALASLWKHFVGAPEDPGSESSTQQYWMAMILISGGALLLIGAFPGSLKGLVDLATTLSFLTAPILAWMNHRAVFGPDLSRDQQPSLWLKILSVLGIVFLGTFALFYLTLML